MNTDSHSRARCPAGASAGRCGKNARPPRSPCPSVWAHLSFLPRSVRVGAVPPGRPGLRVGWLCGAGFQPAGSGGILPPVPTVEVRRGGTGNTGQGCPVNRQARMPAPQREPDRVPETEMRPLGHRRFHLDGTAGGHWHSRGCWRCCSRSLRAANRKRRPWVSRQAVCPAGPARPARTLSPLVTGSTPPDTAPHQSPRRSPCRPR